jgi:hypothetical protein
MSPSQIPDPGDATGAPFECPGRRGFVTRPATPTSVWRSRLLGIHEFWAVVKRRDHYMAWLLWILAVILVVAGIVSLIRGAILAGIVLIIVGLLVGPGGVSIFT